MCVPLKKAPATVRHRLRAPYFVCASGVKSSRVRVISMRLRLPPGTVGCIMLITRLTSNLDHVCNKSPLQGMRYGWIDVRPYGFRFVAAFNLKLDTRHSSKLYFMSATVSCLRLGAVGGGAAGRTRAARCSPYRTYQGDFA